MATKGGRGKALTIGEIEHASVSSGRERGKELELSIYTGRRILSLGIW